MTGQNYTGQVQNIGYKFAKYLWKQCIYRCNRSSRNALGDTPTSS